MSDADDPFKPPDATVVRPRPGAGRRGPGESPRQARPAHLSPVHDEPVTAIRDGLGIGLSPLVQAATPLLLMAGQLRGTLASRDVTALRRQCVEEVKRFEERARTSDIPPEIVRAARYALCSSVDEAVLSTPWGTQSGWAQQTLLVELHREAWGGEKFFEMLERISHDPARHLDLMELQYFCIALGFAGKYHAAERGYVDLAGVQHETYRRIRGERGTPPPELSIRWRGLEDRRNPLIRYVPWWVVGAAALALVAVTFTLLASWLRSDVAPVQEALSKVGDIVPGPLPGPIVGPTIRQLLRSDEASGAVAIDENGAQTSVVPQGELFASGSAAVNPQYNVTLQHIAAAINQVPGRVVVTGHTDDQPVRSSRFLDNFELSRERAVSVAKILQQTVSNPGRIMWNGVASSRPKYVPESLPENRARNRRVEIVHVRDR